MHPIFPPIRRRRRPEHDPTDQADHLRGDLSLAFFRLRSYRLCSGKRLHPRISKPPLLSHGYNPASVSTWGLQCHRFDAAYDLTVTRHPSLQLTEYCYVVGALLRLWGNRRQLAPPLWLDKAIEDSKSITRQDIYKSIGGAILQQLPHSTKTSIVLRAPSGSSPRETSRTRSLKGMESDEARPASW
ncbi:hypothetical protein L249_8240 [Ophiocordyceps polyrhachis-furcata BCC 54312]|uniref:Uncharacterized protein n=1 Tax=Ophiocordyceps polyrhachis-furcata BCC 54312 TaxID=1330021 RepID=A0A367LHG0_9HYPO|nr:hypothetical protein L249_8240 [Ophiocordyceps polyrhachis-furcata BCC 54312]